MIAYIVASKTFNLLGLAYFTYYRRSSVGSSENMGLRHQQVPLMHLQEVYLLFEGVKPEVVLLFEGVKPEVVLLFEGVKPEVVLLFEGVKPEMT